MKTFPSSAQQKVHLGKLRGVANLKTKGPGVEEPILNALQLDVQKECQIQKLCFQVHVPLSSLKAQKPTGACPPAFGGSPRPAVEDFSSLDVCQCSKPRAGFGKLIPSIIAFSQVDTCPFPFPKPDDILKGSQTQYCIWMAVSEKEDKCDNEAPVMSRQDI